MSFAGMDDSFHARLIARLRDPARHGPGCREVRLIETHISSVLLTGEFAYKLKKPVALGFLVALWTFARWLRAPSWLRLLLAGLALGGALLVKFTALLLLPLLALAAAVWAARLRGGAMTDAVRALLAAWLERDPEHQWVLSRYRTLCGHLDEHLGGAAVTIDRQAKRRQLRQRGKTSR